MFQKFVPSYGPPSIFEGLRVILVEIDVINNLVLTEKSSNHLERVGTNKFRVAALPLDSLIFL